MLPASRSCELLKPIKRPIEILLGPPKKSLVYPLIFDLGFAKCPESVIPNPRLVIICSAQYAHGKWVENSHVEVNTTYEYRSDFDLLIVTDATRFRKNQGVLE